MVSNRHCKFSKFSQTISGLGYSASLYDSALFIQCTSRGIILLLLYIDDMIITEDDLMGIQDLKQFLNLRFEMKDLGPLSYFLGFEITTSIDGYYLTQAKYVSNVLSKSGLTDSKIVDTPLECNTRLNLHDGKSLRDGTSYHQLMSGLLYLNVTHPNISHVVHIASQFMIAPRSTHFVVIHRIFRYLKGTMFYGLHFSSQSLLILRAYSNADQAGDPTDRYSTIGYCFFLGDSLIS
ncbi:uncharacterized mitochondrial protein AtMg00810-like [Cornus florida]|uniref:uncharacterized mitochondrial protein AtMg00810-like n=1 Tax=Cornus florida TaxID=4283 RepID=UPI00289FB92B|nr:uncharacterized mitochondrial protein AtMg00810-like [Cornus florida]